jgi:hypothetical protein
MRLSLEISVIRLGTKRVALAQVGGFRVRGAPAKEVSGAVKNLLWTLSGQGPQNDDAELGLELWVNDTNLQAEMEEQRPALNEAYGGQDEVPFPE